MAKLIKNDEQVNACKEINLALEEVKKINARILSSDPMAISIGPKQTIVLDGKFTDKIVAVLKAQRQILIKEILQKSKKFRISLEESEEAMISDKALDAPAVSLKTTEKPNETKEMPEEAFEDGVVALETY